MKKIFFAISTLVLSAGFLSSCQKEIAESQEKGGGSSSDSKFTITATIADNGTKVSYKEDESTHALKPSWTSGDVIIGFDANGETYGFQTEENSEKAKFSIITTGEYVGTATTCPDNNTKMYMFYAPGKKPSEIDSKTLIVSLASQSKDVIPALMMASGTVTNNSIELSFENKCAIIGIKNPTMAAAGKDYTSIKLSGTAINTEVKFSLSGETLQAEYQTSGEITKTVGFTSATNTKAGPAVIYIAVCPTTSTDLIFESSDGCSFSKSSTEIVAGNYYYMTPTFVKPLLPGKFTVDSSGKQVQFTSGNLYYCTTDGKYHIEDAQNVTYATLEQSSYVAAHVCHFFWSNLTDYQSGTASYMPYASSYSYSSRTNTDNFFCGAANMLTVDGQSNLYALSINEWSYLIDTRTNASKLYKYGVSVCDKSNCLVIAPDGYTGTIASSYNASAWPTAEAAGLVCLPAAGSRSGSSLDGQGSYGYYWSSSPYGREVSGANRLYFSSSYVNSFDNGSRSKGSSIRLVY